MLLAIDVGNTDTVFGVFDGHRLTATFRLRSDPALPEPEFARLLSGAFAGHQIPLGDIEKTVIASVVPAMAPLLSAFGRSHLSRPPVWIHPDRIPTMPNRCDSPAEVGADRIVNALAAYRKYRTGLIVIDFGTATTFDVVSEEGEFLGGAICPGIGIAAEALIGKTAKLPRVELKVPKAVIGKNTTEAIQSGLMFGYGGLVDGMVKRIGQELGKPPRVIATGGLAPLMEGVSETIDTVAPDLTLEGLRILGEEL